MASSTEVCDNILSTGEHNKSVNNDGTPQSADKHKLENANAAAAAGKETAHMTLRGYPLLKAKATVEVTGVGKGSGVWYCKTVTQEWHVDHGYLTNALLTKGSGGKAPGTGKKPATSPAPTS